MFSQVMTALAFPASDPSPLSLPAERHPALAYLANLGTAKARRSQASALDSVALELGGTVAALPWASLRYPHVAVLRARLAARLAPATVNRMLCAVRGVLREAAKLDLMSSEDCTRACAVPGVKGSRQPKGRALPAGELSALLGACNGETPAGRRDAALLSAAYGAGLRRAELVSLEVGAVDLATGAVRVLGKGNVERIAYLPAWALVSLRAWLDARGPAAGPLFSRVDKAGAIDLSSPLSDEAVRFLFARLAERAGVAAFTPHDTRRSFISDLLDAGADISTVQQLAGHAQVTTTQRYDRRGEVSKRRAVALLRDPSAG
jgi:site-specific recombinase XerD